MKFKTRFGLWNSKTRGWMQKLNGRLFLSKHPGELGLDGLPVVKDKKIA